MNKKRNLKLERAEKKFFKSSDELIEYIFRVIPDVKTRSKLFKLIFKNREDHGKFMSILRFT